MVSSRRTYAVEVSQTSKSAPATVFAKVADGARWSEWARPFVAYSKMERLGDPAPGGVGGVRVLGRKPVLVREETLEYEQDRRHVYTMRSPSPMGDYRGEVVLTPRADGGTDLVWRCSFTEKIPGTGPVLRIGLLRLITLFARKLAR